MFDAYKRIYPPIAEAILRDDWRLWQKATQKESQQLRDRHTWDKVNGKLIKLNG